MSIRKCVMRGEFRLNYLGWGDGGWCGMLNCVYREGL